MKETEFRRIMGLIHAQELHVSLSRNEAGSVLAAKIWWSTRTTRFKRMWQKRQAKWRVEQALHQIAIEKIFTNKLLTKYEENLTRNRKDLARSTAISLDMPIETIHKAIRRYTVQHRKQLRQVPRKSSPRNVARGSSGTPYSGAC